MILETDRLILREYTQDDFDAIYEILSDVETMKHYPKPFDAEKVHYWINWNLENYKTFGFGLFAIVLKETGKLIGDCGITMQTINGKIKPEIGYHIHKDYQRKSFWKDIIGNCSDIEVVKTWEMNCFESAWKEWFDTKHKLAMNDLAYYENVIKPYTTFIGIMVKKKA